MKDSIKKFIWYKYIIGRYLKKHVLIKASIFGIIYTLLLWPITHFVMGRFPILIMPFIMIMLGAVLLFLFDWFIDEVLEDIPYYDYKKCESIMRECEMFKDFSK